MSGPAVHDANSLLSDYKITLRKMGGFLNAPTPGGVPVRNTSPGINVTNLSGGEKHRVEYQKNYHHFSELGFSFSSSRSIISVLI